MLRIALRSLLGYKLRTLLVSLAIVLGVGFVAGTLILTDGIRSGFNNLYDEAYSQVDLIVKHDDFFNPHLDGFESCLAEAESQATADVCYERADDNPIEASNLSIDEALAETIRAVAGIAIVEPVVEGRILLLDTSGESLWSNPFGGLGRAFAWPTQPGISPLALVADTGSRAPQARGEVVIDEATAEKHNLKVGDQVKLESARFNKAAEEATIVGLATYGSDRSQLTTFAALSLAEAQRLFGLGRTYSELNIQLAGNTDPELTKTHITQVLPDSLLVISAEEQADQELASANLGLDFLTGFLLTFAGIAIFVAVFVIQNTFRIILGQRTRELALLRILGANKRQIIKVVLIEALFVGVLGALLGLVVGIGLAQLTQTLLSSSDLPVSGAGPVVSLKTVIISFLVGSVVATTSAIMPAIRASRVAPLEALSEIDTPPTTKSLFMRTIVGAVICCLGGACLAYGLTGAAGTSALVFTGFGATLMFIGVAILAPILCRLVAYLVARPLALIWRMPAKLAHGNIRRQPRQVAAAASTLMIGVSLIVLVTVLASSLRAAINKSIAETFPADLIVYSQDINILPNDEIEEGPTEGTIPPTILKELQVLPELQDVTAVRYSLMDVSLAPSGRQINLAGVDADSFDQVLKLKFSNRAVANLAEGQLLVREKTTQDEGWQIGDNISLDYHSTGVRTYRLGGTFSEAFDTNFILSSEAYLKQIDDDVITYIAMNAVDGVTTAEAKDRVAQTVEDYSSLAVFDQSDLIGEAGRLINSTLSVFRGLLGLSLVIAVFGIINTLFLAVVERTRELGLLRAVGMTRRQLRRMIRIEAVIIALFGSCLGTAMGVLFGWAIIRSLASEGITTFVLPVPEIAVYLALAILAGVLAAVWPAFKASRLDILKAIAHH